MPEPRLGVRWTIGDVAPAGFEALRLSIAGAWRCFGPRAAYIVCVNSVPADVARARTGPVPAPVVWHETAAERIPAAVRRRLDPGLAEGAAWKLAPPRLFPDRHELALDNDCILWDVPAALRTWLDDPDPGRCLVAADVAACFGRFAALCGPEPRNAGLRGLPPGYDLAAALEAVLEREHGPLDSETDEQGLQVAALCRPGPPVLVPLDDVTVCSPFPPHLPRLGRCGAHFVGLNARSLPWTLDGRPATDHLREHWERLRPELYARTGLRPLAGAA